MSVYAQIVKRLVINEMFRDLLFLNIYNNVPFWDMSDTFLSI